MNRENKLALIIGFTLILIVGVLVSDHLSKANSAELGEGAVVEQASSLPISGGRFEETQATIAAATPPATRPEIGPAPIDPALGLNPGLLVIDQGSADEPVTLGGIAVAAGDTFDRVLDMYRDSGVRPAVDTTRRGPSVPIEEPTRALPTYIEHEVRQNENLYRIALRYLGDGERWREVRDANRAKVGADGAVAVGTVLRVEILEPAGSPGAIPTVSQALEAAQTREYTVKAGDILGKIAQQELGTVRRMGEILELNRDLLKSADSIREGMRLKLPAE